MADHSAKVGFGLSTSQIVSSDSNAMSVLEKRASNLQEQSGGKHNRGLSWTSDWQNNRMEHQDMVIPAENAAADPDTKQLRSESFYKSNQFAWLCHFIGTTLSTLVFLPPCCGRCLRLSLNSTILTAFKRRGTSSWKVLHVRTSHTNSII